MLDISRFDKVFCIHFLPFTDRFEDIKNEFKRIGLDTESKKFQWKFTFFSPFQYHLFNNPYFPIVRGNKYFFDGNKNCTLAHYEIYKECLGLGYKRILVIEDDMVFLRDVDEINAALAEMPDTDIVLFDKWMHDKEKYKGLIDNRRISDRYSEYDDGMLSTGMYSITDKGMEHVVANQEFLFQPADYWINRQSIGVIEDNITRSFCIKNLAIQNFSYTKLINGTIMPFYENMGFYSKIIDLSEYDIVNKRPGNEAGGQEIKEEGSAKAEKGNNKVKRT